MAETRWFRRGGEVISRCLSMSGRRAIITLGGDTRPCQTRGAVGGTQSSTEANNRCVRIKMSNMRGGRGRWTYCKPFSWAASCEWNAEEEEEEEEEESILFVFRLHRLLRPPPSTAVRSSLCRVEGNVSERSLGYYFGMRHLWRPVPLAALFSRAT